MTADASFKQYPYFLFPQAAALAEAVQPEERTRLVRRVASLVGDTSALQRLLGVVPEEFSNFYPDQLSPDLSTEDTISSFLEHFGGRQTGNLPDGSQGIPVMPAVDYAAMLDRLEEEADAPMPTLPETALTDSRESVRKLVKEGNHRDALDMLVRIQLRSDEGDPLIEDQIRFLRKLILNNVRRHPVIM